jgi:hypothetical protein
MNNPVLEALHRELASIGGDFLRIEHGGKHPRMYFRYRGKEMFYVFSGSTGDSRRARYNAVTDLRKLCNVEGKQPAPKQPKVRRHTSKRRAALPVLQSITPGQSPLDALSDIRFAIWLRDGLCKSDIAMIDRIEARICAAEQRLKMEGSGV